VLDPVAPRRDGPDVVIAVRCDGGIRAPPAAPGPSVTGPPGVPTPGGLTPGGLTPGVCGPAAPGGELVSRVDGSPMLGTPVPPPESKWNADVGGLPSKTGWPITGESGLPRWGFTVPGGTPPPGADDVPSGLTGGGVAPFAGPPDAGPPVPSLLPGAW